MITNVTGSFNSFNVEAETIDDNFTEAKILLHLLNLCYIFTLKDLVTI